MATGVLLANDQSVACEGRAHDHDARSHRCLSMWCASIVSWPCEAGTDLNEFSNSIYFYTKAG